MSASTDPQPTKPHVTGAVAPRTVAWGCFLVFLGSLAVHWQFALVGWHNSLLEFHSFRQVQTALLVREFIDHGINFGSPLPLFGPPWYVPFEFPIYQATAAFVAVMTGWPLAESGRLTSLGFFYAGLPALFLMLDSLRVKRAHRWLVLALVVLCPTYLYYSRTVMIESCAWALSLWFLCGFGQALREGSRSWWFVAIAAGVLAGLTKVTTYAAFLVPAIIFTLAHLAKPGDIAGEHRRHLRWAVAKRALSMALPGLVMAWLWIKIGDELKSQNPLSAVMTSPHLREFILGTAELRMGRDFWTQLLKHAGIAAVVPINLGLILVWGVIWTDRRRWTVLALVLAFLGGPLIFANLYFVHDYYFYATSVFLLLALGMTWARLLEWTALPRWSRFAIVLTSLGLQVAGYAKTYLNGQIDEQIEVAELPRILNRAVPPDGVLLVFGQDWNPLLPYYAEHRTIMVIDQKFEAAAEIGSVLDRLTDGVAAIVTTGVIRNYPEFLTPYLTRFEIPDRPLLESSDTSIYLRARDRAGAIERLADFPSKAFDYPVAPAATNEDARPRFTIAELADQSVFARFSPLPRELIHPFAVSKIERANGAVLSSHASSDLFVPIPPKSTTVEVGFGLMPGAYENAAAATDGVEFLFEYTRPDGQVVTLAAVMLDPVSRPADRGDQVITLDLPQLDGAELRLRTLPGPHQSPAFDWSYWSHVRIR